MVLDLACGPGSATRLAAEAVGPSGRVTGFDLSPAMLEVARTKTTTASAAPIEYIEAPADALPVAEASFDVAVCQQGLQFFPDRQAALAEMHRALRPGGRLGVAVWTEISDSPLFFALYKALLDVAGAALADRYRNGPWGFPDAGQLLKVLEGAGFSDVRVEGRSLDVRFESGPSQFASTLAASGIAADIETFGTPTTRQAHPRIRRPRRTAHGQRRHPLADGLQSRGRTPLTRATRGASCRAPRIPRSTG